MPRLFPYFMVLVGIITAQWVIPLGEPWIFLWTISLLSWLMTNERRNTIWFREQLKSLRDLHDEYVDMDEQMPDSELEEVRDMATRLLAAKRKKDFHPEVF